MINNMIIEFLEQEQIQDKVCLRKLDNGLKMVAEGLHALDKYISSSLPELLNAREIKKLKEYADIIQYIDCDINEIQEINKQFLKFFDSRVSSAESNKDTASELYILDMKCKDCCSNELVDIYSSVEIFDDNGTVVLTKNVWTKYCSICGKHYIYEGMANALNESNTNHHIYINGMVSEASEIYNAPPIITLTVIEKADKCPTCKAEIISEQIDYCSFKDIELNVSLKGCKLYARRCNVCKKIYITCGTYDAFKRRHTDNYTNLQFEFNTDIELMGNQAIVSNNKCKHLGCDSVANHDGYCNFHYSEERYLAK